jgi:hypothetical protein
MIRYRLVLVGEPPMADRYGYVFCTRRDAPHAAARRLLDSHPAYAVVRIYQDGRLVGEIARGRPCAEAAE